MPADFESRAKEIEWRIRMESRPEPNRFTLSCRKCFNEPCFYGVCKKCLKAELMKLGLTAED